MFTALSKALDRRSVSSMSDVALITSGTHEDDEVLALMKQYELEFRKAELEWRKHMDESLLALKQSSGFGGFVEEVRSAPAVRPPVAQIADQPHQAADVEIVASAGREVDTTVHKPKKIFISYCWRNSRTQKMQDFQAKKCDKTEVEKAGAHTKEIITALNLDPWLDVDQLNVGNGLEGSLADVLSDEVDIVIVHASDEYAASVNCRKEFEFASSLDLKIIPLVIGDNAPAPIKDVKDNKTDEKQKASAASATIKPWNKSWLGFSINHTLYVDARNPNELDTNVKRVKETASPSGGFKSLREALQAKSETEVVSMVKSAKPEELNAIVEDGENVFDLAVGFCSLETVKLFVERGVKPTENSVGRKRIVEFFLEKGCDVNAYDSKMSTALHIAASVGSSECCDVLLDHKADTELVNTFGFTPLLSAVSSLNVENVRLLLRRGANANAIDEHSEGNAINMVSAVYHGKTSVVKTLASLPNCKEIFSAKNFASLAASNGHIEVLKFLTSTESPVKYNLHEENGDGYNSLSGAISTGNLEVIKHLVNTDSTLLASVMNYTKSILMMAAEEDKYDIVKYLAFESGYNFDLKEMDDDRFTILAHVVSGNDVDLVKQLIEREPSLLSVKTKANETVFHIAAKEGGSNVDVVNYLLTLDAQALGLTEITSDAGETALTGATLLEREPVALLQPNPIDFRTPLHECAEFNQIEPLKFLINWPQYKHDLTLWTSTAIQSDNPEMLEYLLSVDENLINITVEDSHMVFYGATNEKWDSAARGFDYTITDDSDGKVEVLKFLMELDSELINVLNSSDESVLIKASYYGHMDVVKYLLSLPNLKYGVEHKDNDGWTAIACAVHTNSVEMIKELHNAAKNPELFTVTVDGKNLLRLAVENGDDAIEMVKYLVATGKIDIKATDDSDQTAFTYACYYGRLECVRYLMSVDSSQLQMRRPYDSATVLHLAATNDNVELVKLLTSTKKFDLTELDGSGNTPLANAINGDYWDCPAAAHQGPNKSGYTLAHLAVYSGDNLGLLKLVLEHGNINLAEKDHWNYTVLATALNYGRNQQALHLISLDPAQFSLLEPSDDATNLVHLAIQNGDFNVFKSLMQAHKFDVHQVNSSGYSPLAQAVSLGDRDKIGQYLIDLDPTTVDFKYISENRTILQIFVSEGGGDHLPFFKKLVESGKFDLHNKDKGGHTVFSKAVERGYLKIVKYLYGIDETLLNWGETKTQLVFSTIKEGDSVETLKFLLSVGHFDLNEIDDEERTPLAVAMNLDRPKCAKYLIGFDGSLVSFNAQNMDLFDLCFKTGNLDLTVANSDGLTPLALAAQNGLYEFVTRLLAIDSTLVSCGDEPNKKTLLQLAINSGDNHRLLKFLLDHTSVDLSNVDTDGHTVLSRCIANDYIQCSKLLIKQKPELLNFIFEDEKQNMAQLAAPKSYQLLKIVMSAGSFDLSNVDKDGKTAIVNAIQSCNTKSVILLIKQDQSQLKYVSEDGSNLLHFAVMDDNNYDTLKVLLEYKDYFDFNAKNSDGHSVFSKALSWKSTRCAKHLAKFFATTDKSQFNFFVESQKKTLLHLAAEGSDDVALLNLLLANGKYDLNQIDVDGHTPFSHAVLEGKEDMIQRLYEFEPSQVLFSPNPESGNKTLLQMAILFQAPTVLKDLGNIDSDGNTFFSKCVQCGRNSVFKYAADYTAKWNASILLAPNAKNQTLLHNAADNITLTKTLTPYGKFDLHQKDSDGFTPFALAVKAGNFEVVSHLFNIDQTVLNFRLMSPASHTYDLKIHQLLVQNGKFDFCEEGGEAELPPFLLALLQDNVKIAKYLLSQEPKAIEYKGRALNISAVSAYLQGSNCSEDGLKLLLEEPNGIKFDLVQRDCLGDSPLSLAVSKNLIDCCKVLLAHNPSLLTESKCCDDMTLLETAVFYGNQDLFDYLLELWDPSVLTDDDKYLSLLTHATFGGEGVRDGVLLKNETYQKLVEAVPVDESDSNSQTFAVMSVICTAASSKSLPMTDLALKRGYVVGAKNKNMDLIKMLDKLGVKFDPAVTAFGRATLFQAVQFSVEAVQFFLKLDSSDLRGSPYDNESPFKTACGIGGILEAASIFLELGVDPNLGLNANSYEIEGNTALHDACSTKRVDSMQYLLSVEAVDFTRKNVNGSTGLHVLAETDINEDDLAIENEEEEKEEEEKEEEKGEDEKKGGEKSSEKTDSAETVEEEVPETESQKKAFQQVQMTLTELIKAFVDRGADINAVDAKGRTPLDIAKTAIGSINGESDMTKALVANGATVSHTA
ncbi:ankyrin [Rhizoclosmatium globosum]|uniref:Ankyrin n=1 Tax=Rhizoclosmatium globosum TaxID=329046 RepID=A0A1Y2CT78_9FUNG|nr:ankyrin [Rhizoclosmatium globosum]|eukprot:ORY50054.1 ankyrin [Rhizoclosmatium globosum]